jgi:hypothetical protein
MWFWIILLLLGFAVVGAMSYRRRRTRSPSDPAGNRHEPPNAIDSSNSGWGV